MSSNGVRKGRSEQVATLPGDYKPVSEVDPVGDVLARVYALILSWPERQVEKTSEESEL